MLLFRMLLFRITAFFFFQLRLCSLQHFLQARVSFGVITGSGVINTCAPQFSKIFTAIFSPHCFFLFRITPPLYHWIFLVTGIVEKPSIIIKHTHSCSIPYLLGFLIARIGLCIISDMIKERCYVA